MMKEEKRERARIYAKKYRVDHEEINKEKLRIYLFTYDPNGDHRTKKCNKCGEIKTVLDFYPKTRLKADGKLEYRPTCKNCSRILDSKRRDENRDNIRKNAIKTASIRSWKVMCRIAPDGEPKCTVCGFKSDRRLLQIDHINNDGYKTKTNTKVNGAYTRYTISQLTYEIMRMPITELRKKYQILCVAHNWIKRYGVNGEKYVLITKD